MHTLAALLHTCVHATWGIMRYRARRIMPEQLTRVPMPRSAGASAALQSQASTAYGAAWVRALVRTSVPNRLPLDEQDSSALFRSHTQGARVSKHKLLCCAGEAVAGSLSLRIQQLDVRCETKTLDNVRAP